MKTVKIKFKKRLNMMMKSPQVNKTFAFLVPYFQGIHFQHFNISKVGTHLTITGVLELLSA